MNNGTHISDRELVTAIDDELDETRGAEIRSHLATCPTCRFRRNHLLDTLRDFSDAVRAEFETDAVTKERSRALFRARLMEAASQYSVVSWWKLPVYAGCALAFVLVLATVILHSRTAVRGFEKDSEVQ